MQGLKISGISKTFGSIVALNQVNIEVEPGELFFLLGPSGCGKTTLLRIIAGLTNSDTGSILFNNIDLLKTPIEKRSIGMVFQNYSLWPHMTVFDNVAYGLKMRHISRDKIADRVINALKMVEMESTAQSRPGTLSGGQQQRVALARALVYEPKLLLLDEPLSNLDARLRKEMRQEIQQLHKKLGITMIYVTHDQEEACAMAERICLFNKGSVIQIDTPQNIIESPVNLFAAQFFGSANHISCKVISVNNNNAKVLINGEELTVRSSREIASNSLGYILFRPSSIKYDLNPESSNYKALKLIGKVILREFSGSFWNLVLMTEFGKIGVNFSGIGVPATGETITVSIEESNMYVIPGEPQ